MTTILDIEKCHKSVLNPKEVRLNDIESQKVLGCLDNAIKKISIIMSIEALKDKFPDSYSQSLNDYILEAIEYDKIDTEHDYLLNIRQNRLKEEDDFKKKQTLLSPDFWTKDKTDVEIPSEPVKNDEKYYSTFIGTKVRMFEETDIEKVKMDKALPERHRSAKKKIISKVKGLFRDIKHNDYENVMLLRKRIGTVHQKQLSYANLPPEKVKKTELHDDNAVPLLDGETVFIKSLLDLRRILFIELLTTPQEIVQKQVLLDDLLIKTAQHEATIKKLSYELNEEEKARENEVKELNDKIRQLEAEIKSIETYSSENLKRIDLETEQQINLENQNTDGRIQKLNETIETLEKEYNNLLDGNSKAEGEERFVRFKKESEVETFIAKYDHEMIQMSEEYESIDAEYTEEKRELSELEEKFKTLEEEYNIIMEKRRLREEKLRKEEEERIALLNAATVIQAFWRSYKSRKVYHGKKKGGKNKKKK